MISVFKWTDRKNLVESLLLTYTDIRPTLCDVHTVKICIDTNV